MSNSFDESNTFNAESSQFLRIPSKRIGALIGPKGSTKKRIEEATQTQIVIDSDTGEVEIRPNSDLEDPVQLFNARDITKAIGRGFTIDQAIVLADDSYFLEVIGLKPIIGDKSNHLRRVRSRLIGTRGRTRKNIEELCKIKMMVSGTTISIIGTFENLARAKDAIMAIIKGAKIESVIGRLEEERHKTKREEDSLWESEEDVADLKPEQDIEDPFADYPEDQ